MHSLYICSPLLFLITLVRFKLPILFLSATKLGPAVKWGGAEKLQSKKLDEREWNHFPPHYHTPQNIRFTYRLQEQHQVKDYRKNQNTVTKSNNKNTIKQNSNKFNKAKTASFLSLSHPLSTLPTLRPKSKNHSPSLSASKMRP